VFICSDFNALLHWFCFHTFDSSSIWLCSKISLLLRFAHLHRRALDLEKFEKFQFAIWLEVFDLDLCFRFWYSIRGRRCWLCVAIAIGCWFVLVRSLFELVMVRRNIYSVRVCWILNFTAISGNHLFWCFLGALIFTAFNSLRPNWICVNLLEVFFLLLNADSSEAMIWKLVLCLVNMKYEDRLQWFQTIVCAFIIFCWSLMWRFWFHSNWCLRFRELVCYCGYSFWKLLHFGSDGDVKFRSNNLVLDLVCSYCEGWRTYLDYEIYFVALRLYRFCFLTEDIVFPRCLWKVFTEERQVWILLILVLYWICYLLLQMMISELFCCKFLAQWICVDFTIVVLIPHDSRYIMCCIFRLWFGVFFSLSSI
jgi:hypothetical protein